jgi:TRAP-type uncharacterized transport system substrate-binding protein
MRLRPTTLVVVAASLAAGALAAGSLYVATRPVILKVAVGPAGSEDANFVAALADHLAQGRAGERLRIVVRRGPAESAAAVEAGEADLAVVRRDIAMPADAQAIAILRHNVVAFMMPAPAAKESGRRSKPGAASARARKDEDDAAKPPGVEEIAGKRIGVVDRDGTGVSVLQAVLDQYDIAERSVTIVPLRPEEIATAIRDGKVDALMASGPITSRIFRDAVAAASRGNIAPVFLAVGAAKAIEQRLRVYEATEIAAGTFGGTPLRPPGAVETIGTTDYLVARRGTSEKAVADLTSRLFAVRDSLIRPFPGIGRIEAPDTDKDSAVVVHPAAAAYFKDETKTFLDKYSDFLYLGAMLLSVVGSGIAGAATYVRAGNRAQCTATLDRLLDLIKAARQAESPEVLQGLQSEADEILARMVQQVERNKLDDAALAAFSIALEQAQSAIAQRRSALARPADADRPPEAAVAADRRAALRPSVV